MFFEKVNLRKKILKMLELPFLRADNHNIGLFLNLRFVKKNHFYDFCSRRRTRFFFLKKGRNTGTGTRRTNTRTRHQPYLPDLFLFFFFNKARLL